jgi:hypothetical protein
LFLVLVLLLVLRNAEVSPSAFRSILLGYNLPRAEAG